MYDRSKTVVYYESMKRKLIQNLYMNVGAMKDYKLRDNFGLNRKRIILG
jgi:hypothetical protein